MKRTNASWSSRFWHREKPTDLTSRTDGICTAAYAGTDRSEQVTDRMVLLAALAQLPMRRPQAVVLRYFDDLAVPGARCASCGTARRCS